MEFSMTGQDKGDLLIQVTTWGGLKYLEFFDLKKPLSGITAK
jgi:hypothetical protein